MREIRGGEMRRSIVLALIVLCAGGCATPVTIRQPVTVTRYVYVRVDPSLTAPCPVAMPRNWSIGELLRVARERRASLEGCANARLKAISGIEGTPVP